VAAGTGTVATLDVVAPFRFSHKEEKLSRGRTWWTMSRAALCQHARAI